MNIYIAEICHGGRFLERLRIEAPNRGTAVHKAQLHFWYTYHGRIGTSDQAIVVDDPNNEVCYSDTFKCKDKKNILLPEDIIIRLLKQAHGELIRDTRIGSPHNPRGSVRRFKRRRDFGKFIAPSVRQMKNGKLYYRINTQSQSVHNGRRYRKRKYRDLPLVSQTLADAVEEIKMRELLKINAKIQRRKVVSREVRVLECLAGLITTPHRMSRKFRAVLKHYTPLTVV